MKRVGELLVAFLIVLVIVYMKPVVLSYNQPKLEEGTELIDVSLVEKSISYNELNATGMANYIGMTESNFLKTKPKPLEEWQVDPNRKWLLYGDNSRDYYQIEVVDGVIASVFTLGSETETLPFQFGMTLADISEITTIYSNFDFDFEGEHYSIEFTEDDMNYRPLVAFNNDSFALLHFDYHSSQLIGIRYLDKKTLLGLIPPQNATSKSHGLNNVSPDKEKEFNQAYSDQLLSLLNTLREEDDRKLLARDTHISNVSREALRELSEHPESIFKKEERLLEWEEKRAIPDQSFALNEDELRRVIQKGNPNSKKISGLYANQVYDIPFLVMDWYGERFSYKELTDKRDELTGISIDSHQLLILFGPKKGVDNLTIESSDSQ